MKALLFISLSLFPGLQQPETIPLYNEPAGLYQFFKQQDPIAGFWNWFRENESRLKKFESDPDKYLDELLKQVKKIREGVAIELQPPVNGIINMTVSADGDIDLFPLVKNIIERSPRIKGWNFIAFRQRMPADKIAGMKVKLQDLELDPAKMKFYPVVTTGSLDVIIYVDGVTEENYNQVAYTGLLLLDAVLGEYDCVTKVNNYDFHTMPVKKEDLEGVLPLLELPAYVDRFHASRKK